MNDLPLATDATPVEEYEHWLGRLRSTYESVTFACLHRLHDRALAESVGVHVVAGMLSRPGVFRFHGMPYSARIGHIAEDRIAAAKEGRLEPSEGWELLIGRLQKLPRSQREVVVLGYVHGLDPEAMAEHLGQSVATVRSLQIETLGTLRDIAAEITGEAEDS